MSVIGDESGSVFLSKHQLSHCHHALEYDEFVEDLQDCVIMLITHSESLLALPDLVIQARWLVVGGLP